MPRNLSITPLKILKIAEILEFLIDFNLGQLLFIGTLAAYISCMEFS